MRFLSPICSVFASSIIFNFFVIDAADNKIRRYQYLKQQKSCNFSDSLSVYVASILCRIETNLWFIDKSYVANLENKEICLLGGKLCKQKLPLPSNIPISPAPPASSSSVYQALATIAEKAVPVTWWRSGFSNRKLAIGDAFAFFEKPSPKIQKLIDFYWCTAEIRFQRKPFTFNSDTESSRGSWEHRNSSVVQEFRKLWMAQKHLGGQYTDDNTWHVDSKIDTMLRAAANNVIELIITEFTSSVDYYGCLGILDCSDCREILAAAALVLSLHKIVNLANPSNHKKTHKNILSIGFNIVVGYVLASLGRAVLHGEGTTTAEEATPRFGIAIVDFAGLQSAFLQLYVDSVGALYNKQSNTHIPLAFPPSFPVQAKAEWKPFASQLEPVYTDLHNWMFNEVWSSIDFSPYRPLVAFPAARALVLQRKRRVLIDVGTNGFFASPKYLIDTYAPFAAFTHAVFIEPRGPELANISRAYQTRYNITTLDMAVEVNTGSSADIVKMLPTLVSKEDFVVLKFDVDADGSGSGPTMEWGFLFTLMQSTEAMAVVDELYIELHIYREGFLTYHHSAWEAFDCIRYLRANGFIVHAWP